MTQGRNYKLLTICLIATLLRGTLQKRDIMGMHGPKQIGVYEAREYITSPSEDYLKQMGSAPSLQTCSLEQTNIGLGQFFVNEEHDEFIYQISLVRKGICLFDPVIKFTNEDGTQFTEIKPFTHNDYSYEFVADGNTVDYSNRVYYFKVSLHILQKYSSWKARIYGGNSTDEYQLPSANIDQSIGKYCVIADFEQGENSIPTFAVLNNLAKENFQSLMVLGDFAYNVETNLGQKGDDLFKQMAPITSSLPFVVAPGNHEQFDQGRFFNHRFQMPFSSFNPTQMKPSNHYFGYRQGPVYFVSIDFDYIFGFATYNYQRVLQWLEAELRRASADPLVKAKVFIGHRPFLCSSFDNLPILPDCSINHLQFKTVFDMLLKHGVKLSITGHVHMYTRIQPVNTELEPVSLQQHNEGVLKLKQRVRGEVSDSTQWVREGQEDQLNSVKPAMVNVINGHAGNQVYFPVDLTDKDVLPWDEKALAGTDPNYLVIEFEGQTLTGTLKVSATGQVVDSFNIVY